MEGPIVLVVDPDPAVRASIRGAVARRGCSTRESAEAGEAAQSLADPFVEVMLVHVPAAEGALPNPLRESAADPYGPIVVALTDDGRPALDLIRAGCFDVLHKPPTQAALDSLLERALRQLAFIREGRRFREELRSRTELRAIVGRSAAIDELRGQLRRLAADARPVFLSGETGTGKEFVARALNELAHGANAPFVTFACAGADPAEWEARRRAAAAGGTGTLYLEELPELPAALQAGLAKLLREDRTAEPGFRVVGSSRRTPERGVEQGALSADLLRAFGGEILRLPPLRERWEDIAPLARHFVGTICEINRLAAIRLSAEAEHVLERYAWPANVQELRDAMEQAVILSRDGTIRPRELPERVRDGGGVARAARSFRDAKREVVEGFERTYLRDLMAGHEGNVTAAAEQAGMLRSALQRLLRKYGLKSAEFRKREGAGAEAEG